MENSNKKNKSFPRDRFSLYYGKEMIATFASAPTVMGRLKRVVNMPDSRESYVEFSPVLTFEPDEVHAYLEEKVPATVSLSLFKEDKSVMRSFREGYLRARVKYLNEQADKNSPRIGFGA